MELQEAGDNLAKKEQEIKEGNLSQLALIKEYCENKGAVDSEEKQACIFKWIADYADNFRQLDENLVREYLESTGNRKHELFIEIQAKLEELDAAEKELLKQKKEPDSKNE